MRMNVFIGFLAVLAVQGWSGKLPEYKTDSLVLRMDKSTPRYVDTPIPEDQKSYVKDFREVRLKGVSFVAPNLLTIVPNKYDNPKTPYEALANFFFVGRSGDVKKMLQLHDSSSQAYVDSSLHVQPDSAAIFDYASSMSKVEISDVFECPDMVILFGDQYAKAKAKGFWFFVKEHGVYKKKTGKINLGFFPQLGLALQSDRSNYFIWKK